MKISVITPSLNQREYIEETILSVINQGDYDIEHIIVDGKSTDGTHEILKKYHDLKRIVWHNYKDLGQTDAINYGIAKSTGDIICYLNSDDIFLSGAIDTVLNVFKKNPKVMWLTGNGKIINSDGTETRGFIRFYKNILRKFSNYYLLGIANYIIQPSTFWRREIYNQIGDFNVNLNFVMDYDYWIRIYKLHAPYIIDMDLSGFRVHKKSKSTLYLVNEFCEGFDVVRKIFPKGIALLHRMHDKLIVISYYLFT